MPSITSACNCTDCGREVAFFAPVMPVPSKYRVTVVLVTHSIDEALLLSDQMVLTSSGQRAQISDLIDLPRIHQRKRNMIETHPDVLTVKQCLEDHLLKETRAIEEK